MIAAPASAPALAGDHLSISYGQTNAVPDLSVELAAGKVTAIVGPNGSGKSTVLRTLARLHQPDDGQVLLHGKDIATLPSRDIAKDLAILPQSAELPSGVTVRELISYGRYPYQRFLGMMDRSDQEAIDWAISVTSLDTMKDRAVDTLSGGERQRAWIAMALAQQTGVLLLDEPTTFLDIRYQIDILSLVRDLNREAGLTVGWVLHDLNQAAAYSDYIVMIRDGEIVTEGEPVNVITKPVIQSVFGIDVMIIPDPMSGCPTCLLYGQCSMTAR